MEEIRLIKMFKTDSVELEVCQEHTPKIVFAT